MFPHSGSLTVPGTRLGQSCVPTPHLAASPSHPPSQLDVHPHPTAPAGGISAMAKDASSAFGPVLPAPRTPDSAGDIDGLSVGEATMPAECGTVSMGVKTSSNFRQCACCCASNASCCLTCSAMPRRKSASVCWWKPVTSTCMVEQISSRLSLAACSAISASEMRASSLAPYAEGSSMKGAVSSSSLPSTPPRLGARPSRSARCCSSCLCRSRLLESRSEVASASSASEASWLASTSLTEPARPVLNPRRAERPLTCSACTRRSSSSRKEPMVSAICVKGSESSVSVCERRPNAGPSCSRSAALSARVRTLLWCEAATLATSAEYSAEKARSEATAGSSGSLVLYKVSVIVLVA
mmetsp:Transcript_1493/g.3685  ORF Transcript_1493/g.3685 Transcript_1493/m.3685 type:complete len:354 (+) Transcript_1493:51-1112(+)